MSSTELYIDSVPVIILSLKYTRLSCEKSLVYLCFLALGSEIIPFRFHCACSDALHLVVRCLHPNSSSRTKYFVQLSVQSKNE